MISVLEPKLKRKLNQQITLKYDFFPSDFMSKTVFPTIEEDRIKMFTCQNNMLLSYLKYIRLIK